jgi:hypothetical protein
MDEVDAFLAALRQVFENSSDREELKHSLHRKVAAFIGRAADRGNHYAPAEEVWGLLAEARNRIQGTAFEGRGRLMWVEVLSELDKAMLAVKPRPL